MALRYQYFNGQRRLIPAGRWSQSDDGGNFRIYGLAPGDYYLSATLRGGFSFMEGESTSRSGYAATYFPGTPSEQQAEKISVALGSEITGISFALLPCAPRESRARSLTRKDGRWSAPSSGSES
jgi:hypothetical protein